MLYERSGSSRVIKFWVLHLERFWWLGFVFVGCSCFEEEIYNKICKTKGSRSQTTSFRKPTK